MAKIQAIRGMNDILPGESLRWQYVEKVFRQVVHSYGYGEIRFPLLEQTQLFKRSIGEVTDIVEKEMYSFDDRNGDNLSLRPEGTAGCVRAANQHGLLYNQQQRLWYQGPMFRHERPQKGRYRQFHQFGVEAFGMAGPDIDAEVILLSAAFWRALQLSPHLCLEINNIGSADDRKNYSAALSEFLNAHQDELDDDARGRMFSNPLRVLDSKNPEVQAIMGDAPCLQDYVNDDSQAHFQALQQLLVNAGLEYVINPRLVRGLDYYNNCVFEWTTGILGSQGAVCGGGRYDTLVAQLGGKATTAAGFAMGIERLVLMLDTLQLIPATALSPVDAYLVVVGKELSEAGLALAENLRQSLPTVGLISHCGGGKYNAQLKRAFASGARFAIVLEADGPANGAGGETPETVKLRKLDDSGDTEVVQISNLSRRLTEVLINE